MGLGSVLGGHSGLENPIRSPPTSRGSGARRGILPTPRTSLTDSQEAERHEVRTSGRFPQPVTLKWPLGVKLGRKEAKGTVAEGPRDRVLRGERERGQCPGPREKSPSRGPPRGAHLRQSPGAFRLFPALPTRASPQSPCRPAPSGCEPFCTWARPHVVPVSMAI